MGHGGSGEATINEDGILVESGNAIFNSVQINKDSGNILIANSDVDLSNYEGSWIKGTEGKLVIKSFSKRNYVSIKFLEDNPYIKIEKFDNNNKKEENVIESFVNAKDFEFIGMNKKEERCCFKNN